MLKVVGVMHMVSLGIAVRMRLSSLVLCLQTSDEHYPLVDFARWRLVEVIDIKVSTHKSGKMSKSRLRSSERQERNPIG